MDREYFQQQAEHCRGKAIAFVGKPESFVLLRIAREFDRLARGDLDLESLSIPSATENQPETVR